VSRQLRVTPAASDDIADAYLWYESQRSGLGELFRAELNVSFTLLREFSEAGPAVHRDLRRLLLRRLPYAVYSGLTESEIVIRGCLHSHRNPGAWREHA
jgi:toxin ParE1/3/4